MQSQTKSSGVKLPEFHAVSKNLDPNIQPEKQNIKTFQGNEIPWEKPRMGQGRVGLRRRRLHINQPIAQSAEHLQKHPEVPKIENEVINMPNVTTPVQSISNPSTEMINRRMMQKISKDIPFYPDPTYRPSPKPVRIPISQIPGNIDINLELNTDFEGNLSYLKHTKDQINHFFRNLKNQKV